jgi:hypothetical protein
MSKATFGSVGFEFTLISYHSLSELFHNKTNPPTLISDFLQQGAMWDIGVTLCICWFALHEVNLQLLSVLFVECDL